LTAGTCYRSESINPKEKISMKTHIVLFFVSVALFSTACERKATVCPEGSVTYISDMASFPKLNETGNPEQASGPVTVEIKGKKVKFDRLVEGPFCNIKLSGKVYVGCNIQIPEWDKEENPTFLKNCDFSVEPGSVIYVGKHNNAIFKKGCACHTGEMYKE
jgi:hypothetical protein